MAHTVAELTSKAFGVVGLTPAGVIMTLSNDFSYPTPRSAAHPLRTLDGHLHLFWDTHESLSVSLQAHLLFTCSALIHTSFTCGSICQQGVLDGM